jgi:hypothetical protein
LMYYVFARGRFGTFDSTIRWIATAGDQ